MLQLSRRQKQQQSLILTDFPDNSRAETVAEAADGGDGGARPGAVVQEGGAGLPWGQSHQHVLVLEVRLGLLCPDT